MTTPRVTRATLPDSLDKALVQAETEIECLLGTPELRARLMLILRLELRRSPQLQACDPQSLIRVALWMARLRIDPAIYGNCHILGYKNEVRLILGYIGLMKLLRRSPWVEDVWCRAVHENDCYEEHGMTEPPFHECPDAPRGSPIRYYAVARLTSGEHLVVSMSVGEVIKHRQLPSQALNILVWDIDFEAKALKAVLQQLCHLGQLPMDAEVVEALRDEETSAS